MNLVTAFSQNANSREFKENKKIENQKQIEEIINASQFTFIAFVAIPSGGAPINLSLNHYFLTFKPELIESYLPFYGRAYSGIGYGTDAGLKFKGKPGKYSIKLKKIPTE
jgi:hypothetical protein